MAQPRSIRFEDTTLARLSAYAGRRPGMSASSAASMLVEEGLRMDLHPEVVFRDGPAGRRAVLVGGPDVWEVIRDLRATRGAERDMDEAELLLLVAANADLTVGQVEAALSYYGEFAPEIDEAIRAAAEAEIALATSLARRNTLLAR